MEGKLNEACSLYLRDNKYRKRSRETLIDSGQLRSFGIDCGIILKCILQQIRRNDVVCIYPARKDWL
jgi:hypothetical protein